MKIVYTDKNYTGEENTQAHLLDEAIRRTVWFSSH